METKSPNELDPQSSNYIVSKGHSENNFLSFVTYQDTKKCLPYENVATADQNGDGKKAPIKVKCIPGHGNGTLQIINSLKEVVTLLAPHGNKTKRMDEGNCALVLFYTRTCQGSALVAPHFNAVSKQFPDMKIGAIDALRFHSLNTDFGIVGLPTVMLFHQGMVAGFDVQVEYFYRQNFFLVFDFRSTGHQIQYDHIHGHTVCKFRDKTYWTVAAFQCVRDIRRLSRSTSE